MMDAIYLLLDTLFPGSFLQLSFMKNALLAVLLLTPLLGLLGTMAVNQQMAFFSDALGHSALCGVGLGMLLGVGNDLVSMLVFGLFWAILISRIKQSGKSSADTVISVFSNASLALGLFLLAKGGMSNYTRLLVGDVLAVSAEDLAVMLLMLVLGTAAWALLYNPLAMQSVNPALAGSRGVRGHLVEYAFAALLSLVVMLAIRFVGVLLINALLILPAAAGRNLCRTARAHAAASVGISVLSGIGGLALSYYQNVPAGAAIVLCATAAYFISLAPGAIRPKTQARA
mgnify:CR=1 FL=1